ncbi:hypothetical protein [Arthrobacter glacialis]|nr:hypothetical protein [Arthrobacter glacialis]
MTKNPETTLKARIARMDMKKKVLMGAVGVMALAGLGVGAASAATPVPSPPSSSTQSSNDVSTPGDTPDVPSATETTDQAETSDAAETPGDTGPDVQQTGDHTDPGDLPGSP